MSKIRVAVLRGGPSHGYEDSLKSGARVLTLLSEMSDKYEPVDIFISREGEWHHRGVALKPEETLWHSHVAWNALQGHYGEDGDVHKLLERLKVPHTGSARVNSHLSLHKHLAKSLFKAEGFHTPQHELLTRENVSEDKLIYIFRNFLHPVVVKPTNGTSWAGVRPASTYSELKEAVMSAFSHSPKILVEEFIRGKVASCVVLEGARGEELYALMPVEIGQEEDTCPGSFSAEHNKALELAAKRAHQALGMRHYSVSDFVITPRGKVYILETNSTPAFHEDSHIHKALQATGWREHEFLDHCLKLALK